MKKLIPFILLIAACQDNSNKMTSVKADKGLKSQPSIAAIVTPDQQIAKNTTDSTVYSPNNNPFGVQIKLTMPGADSTGGLISITKNGRFYKEIHSEGIEYRVDLDFNAYYLFKCSKKGYTTKVVYINTKIPKGREKDDFGKFHAEVELHPEVKGVKTDTDKPVGGVKFDKVSDDFARVAD